MFGLGTGEIIAILLVVVLLFGSRKIPELMRGLGSGIKEFKKASNVDDDEPTVDSKKKQDNNDRVTAPNMSESEALEILGLPEGKPDFDSIRRSYKERIAEYHPDKTSHLGKELQELAVKKTIQINSAYEVLSDKYGK